MLGEWVLILEVGDERCGRRAQVGGAYGAVGTITEFGDPSSRVITPWFALFNYPNQVTGLQGLLGRRLPLERRVKAST